MCRTHSDSSPGSSGVLGGILTDPGPQLRAAAQAASRKAVWSGRTRNTGQDDWRTTCSATQRLSPGTLVELTLPTPRGPCQVEAVRIAPQFDDGAKRSGGKEESRISVQ